MSARDALLPWLRQTLDVKPFVAASFKSESRGIFGRETLKIEVPCRGRYWQDKNLTATVSRAMNICGTSTTVDDHSI